jgi:hypothetical protein
MASKASLDLSHPDVAEKMVDLVKPIIEGENK